MRAVAENMSDGEDSLLVLLQCFLNLQTIFQTRRQRLLAHDMQLQWSQSGYDSSVQFIPNAHEGAINTSWDFETCSLILSSLDLEIDEVLPMGELLVRRRFAFAPDVLGSQKLTFELDGFDDDCHLSKTRPDSSCCVCVASRPGTDNGQARLGLVFVAVRVVFS